MDITSILQLPRVRLLVYPEPVRVSYTTVRELVPKLWEGHKIDYAVHIGMASGRRFYSVERRGHRDGYNALDVDGNLLRDDWRRREEGDKWIWHGLPEELLTSVAIDDVWRRWRNALPVCLLYFLISSVLLNCDRIPTFEFRKMQVDIFATSYFTRVWHILPRKRRKDE